MGHYQYSSIQRRRTKDQNTIKYTHDESSSNEYNDMQVPNAVGVERKGGNHDNLSVRC